MIEQPARCGHDDVGMLFQSVRLRLQLHAADQADRRQRVIRAEEIEERFRLQRDLPCRREDQAAHSATVRQAFGDRQRERCGLAGARLRQADDIASGQDVRNHGGLNGCGIDEADLPDGVDDRRIQTEGREIEVGRFDGVLRNADRNHFSWNHP